MALEPMGAFFDARADIYDEVHLGHVGGMPTKDIVAEFLHGATRDILDLGIGTGLELRAVFARFPSARVVGYDISAGMLQKLREAYPGRDITLHEADYTTAPLGTAQYDAIITVMTLHHYTRPEKLALFQRLHAALRPGGRLVECDYLLPAEEFDDPDAREAELLAAFRNILREENLPAGAYHFDTPLAESAELALLAQAGFRSPRRVWRQQTTVVLVADK